MKIWQTLTVLRHHYPLNDKVTLLIEALENDEQGEWSYSEEDGHVIKISPKLPEDMRDEVLVHEYAHAICSYLPCHLSDCCWGVCYGELYKLIFGDH